GSQPDPPPPARSCRPCSWATEPPSPTRSTCADSPLQPSARFTSNPQAMSATPAPTTYTLQALLADHGAAISSFAYLVLQHQTDAERILASTLASALPRADLSP